MVRTERRFFKSLKDMDDDPLSGMANLFDLAMVFAVALMVAMVVNFQMTEFLTNDEFTVVKNPGKSDMEIIVKKGKKIERYKGTESSGEGKGKKIGIAYELENGDIIYVPE
ncbi:MAG: DUF2149 domain-containing protein [Candidatus Moranbacteria bacterium]|nr:DUF2149 domain-containing protein [Candidatus Moranbacteria bacterium]